MKLLYKYSRVNLVTSVMIFLFSSIAFYFSLHYVLLEQVEEDLLVEKHEIESFALRNLALPELIPLSDEITQYAEVKAFSSAVNFQTVNVKADDNNAYRELSFYLVVNGKNYRISVAKTMDNIETITKSVIMVSTVSVLILLIAVFIINRIVLKRLWMPFYRSLEIMKGYRIGQRIRPVFDKTDIDEFNTLNETLSTTIKNSEREYSNLKEFTENASHEMQTPVAVIRSKLDLLIQDEELSESQSDTLQVVYGAINKLARLNHALLLLTKIENRQFSEKENVRFDMITAEKLKYFTEIIQNKNLKLDVYIKPALVNVNPVLVDILLNNLISNSIRHSENGGEIVISLTQEKLTVSNGRSALPLNAELIFERFHKGGNSNEEHGLGLAIVKEICVTSGFRIEYNHSADMHSFKVIF